ncbi:hypothetical protein HOU03_gp206 [Caulobacter phage CcrSC]|uniref:Uncharacterized protein n=1 Tax=Caulobacter phage CcrSC TaxID=2283272 RepID=A0A385EGI2_9CAUD|nr:hypothetical protein HOU03_gp206 [Caulobacter phage CcrSC]AXQ70062.1 hypothetical protein CcrSC_gp480 [Caulobacter phage CcrSC]
MNRKPRPVSVRGKAELVEGTKVRFICPLGHTQVEDLGRKSLPLPRRYSAEAVKRLAHWWRQGVTFDCKRCTRDNHKT